MDAASASPLSSIQMRKSARALPLAGSAEWVGISSQVKLEMG